MANRVKVFLFIIIGIIITALCRLILVPRWNYPKHNDNISDAISLFNNLDGEIQVFFVGVSHSAMAISPMRLYEKYGIVSYNISTSGQPIAGGVFFTEEIFKKHTPKLIVIDISNLFSKYKGEYEYRNILNDLSLSSKKQLAEKFIGDYTYLNEVDRENVQKVRIGAYFPLYRFHDRWKELVASDFKNNNSDYFLAGYVPNCYIAPSAVSKDEIENIAQVVLNNSDSVIEGYSNGRYFKSETNIDSNYNTHICDENIEYLKRIKELCDNHDCKLLLTKIPVNKHCAEYGSSWTFFRHDEVCNKSQELGIDFIDLNYDTNLEIEWEKDTCDGGAHLNVRGANKVTDYIGQYLIDNYDIDVLYNYKYQHDFPVYDKFMEVADLESSYTLTEYLESFEKVKNRTVMLISAKDDMMTGLQDDDKNLLKSLGLQTDFSSLNYSDSFLAVIDEGKVVYECKSNHQQEYDYRVGHAKVHLSSGGYLDGNRSEIQVDGVEKSRNCRGLNFVLIDKESGIVIDRMNIDTYLQEHNVWHDNGNTLYAYEDYLMGN